MVRLNSILALGIILLLGVTGGRLAALVRLPAVTGYLIMGLFLGPSFLNIVPGAILYELGPINELALGIIAFSIGGELTLELLQRMGKNITRIFLGEFFATFTLVTLVSYWISRSLPIALLLGVLSLATAPGAIIMILQDYRAKGEFPKLLLSLVALDNLFCIISFGFITAILQVIVYGGEGFSFLVFWSVIGNLFFSVLVGLFLGFFLTYLTRYSLSESKHLIILLGAILVGVGTGIALHLSSLLIAMVMGFMVVNYSLKPAASFKMIHQVDTPILVAFLTMAGLKLNIWVLSHVGLLGLGYILARMAGKILGSGLGAVFCTRFIGMKRRYIGFGLTPQAGVAIGLSVLAEQKLPLPEGLIVSLILSTVVIFELVGPLMVKKALLVSGSIESGPV